MNIEKYKSFKSRVLSDFLIMFLLAMIVTIVGASAVTGEAAYLAFALLVFIILIINVLKLKNYLTEAKIEDGFLHLGYYHFSEKRRKKIPLEKLKVRIARTGKGHHHTLYIKEGNKTVLSQEQDSGDWDEELLFKTFDYFAAHLPPERAVSPHFSVYNPGFVHFVLVFFWPVGLVLLWKSPEIAPWWKITASLLVAIAIIAVMTIAIIVGSEPPV